MISIQKIRQTLNTRVNQIQEAISHGQSATHQLHHDLTKEIQTLGNDLVGLTQEVANSEMLAQRVNLAKWQPKPPLIQILAAKPSASAVGAVNTADLATAVTALGRQQVANVRRWVQEIGSLYNGKSTKSPEEQAVDRSLVMMGAAFALASAGPLIFPPLQWAAVPLLFYSARGIFRRAYRSVFIDHKLRADTLNVILMVGWVVGGYLALGVFAIFSSVLWEKLELLTRQRSEQSIINLFGQQPHDVAVLINGQEVMVPFDQVAEAALVVVYAGEMIPVDGIVEAGEAMVDQQALTGEAQPVEKTSGSPVLAATTVIAGKLYVRTQRAGKTAVAAQITDVLNQTASYQTTIESWAVTVVDKAVPYRLVLTIAALPVAGVPGALIVLMSGFGASMRALGPLSTLNFLNIASHAKILIKDGRSLELLPKVTAVVFDKTGTLTSEQPYVAAIYALPGCSQEQVLATAASAEYKQTHPIARAIVEYAQAQQIAIVIPDETQYEVGLGIRTQIDAVTVLVGSLRFMEGAGILLPAELQNVQTNAGKQGYSLIYVALEQQLIGAIELHSTVRTEVPAIVQTLRQRGIKTYIISGDHEAPTRALAQTLGVDHYYAETLPADKAHIIEQLQAEGHSVCFIGDGINDSIALRKAHVSISMCGATTIATDAAQIVMMDSSLAQLIPLFDLTQEYDQNMKTNYIIVVAPSIVGVCGVFLHAITLPVAVTFGLLSVYSALVNTMLPLLRHRIKPALVIPERTDFQ